jgi:hypothetical protein
LFKQAGDRTEKPRLLLFFSQNVCAALLSDAPGCCFASRVDDRLRRAALVATSSKTAKEFSG